ncbi:MAG: RNA polymerase sigma factor [Sphingobacteriales bacterium]
MASLKTPSDDELITLLKKGDQAAYAEIYKRYVITLVRFAESKLYDMEEARDLVHDLFTNLWSEKDTLIIKDNLKSYLFAVTRFQIINKIRKNVVREEYAAKLRSISPAFHSLEEELNARELDANIRTKLAELPDKTQYIYQQSRVEEKTIQEIADDLNLSNQTVKNQVSIALKHLRQSLSSFLFTFF